MGNDCAIRDLDRFGLDAGLFRRLQSGKPGRPDQLQPWIRRVTRPIFSGRPAGPSNSQRIVNNDGGGCPYGGNLADGTPINRSFAGTNFFGWYVSCLNGSCRHLGPTLGIRGIQLGATETGSPSLTAAGWNNLFYQNGWVRGNGWGVALSSSDPSGVCNERAVLNGILIQGPISGLNRASWVQCSVPSLWIGPSVDTTGYPAGTPLHLIYQAENAAGNWSSSATATSYIDNSPVDLSLSGPTDAATTAGTQRITATATGGPSGVGAISCSVDGSPWVQEPVNGAATQTATAQVPVGGLGSHHVSCYASNRAVDPSGAAATSPTRNWSLRIGVPVSAGLTFSKLIRSCKRVTVGHKARIRCKTRSVTRRVARVAHGQRTPLRGWFATSDGTALSHVPISIMATPADNPNGWRKIAAVVTSADGSWSAVVPSGPSRLIAASYAGGPNTEPASSPHGRLLVPAKSTLRILRAVVHFGAFGVNAEFEGRMVGGYVPPRGATIAVQALDRGIWRTIATATTDRRGRWRAHYRITGGPGGYAIRVYIPRQGGYPWEAAYSGRATLLVEP